MGSASPEVERVGVEAHAERGMVCRRRGRVVATGFVEQVELPIVEDGLEALVGRAGERCFGLHR